MPIEVRGRTDEFLARVIDALERYDAQHPGARIVVYRQYSASIRVRIIDPGFSGISRADRHEAIWIALDCLPEEVQSQVSLLLLLTPEEIDSSFANVEFDNPIPSRL